MTRIQQINNAALTYVSDSHGLDDIECVIQEIQDDFIAGAKWADEHPNWHKYPDIPFPVKNKIYIIAAVNTDNNEILIGSAYIWGVDKLHLETHSPMTGIREQDVIAWMEIPKSSKFN